MVINRDRPTIYTNVYIDPTVRKMFLYTEYNTCARWFHVTCLSFAALPKEQPFVRGLHGKCTFNSNYSCKRFDGTYIYVNDCAAPETADYGGTTGV